MAPGQLGEAFVQSGKDVIEVEGRKTAVVVKGGGAPAVVFISGLGDGMSSWTPILGRIAARTTAFAYDRPGYGESAPCRHGRAGRDGIFVARHLKASLTGAGIAPPYVVVGHSLGGLYALGFAKAFPNDIAGLVLLDMRAPTYSQACAAHRSVRAEAPWYATLFLPAHMKAEIHGAAMAEQQAQTLEELDDIPVTVVAAAKPDPGIDRAVYDLWRDEQKKFADRLAAGRFVIADDCAHDIHKDNPDLVANEILTVVDIVAAARTA